MTTLSMRMIKGDFVVTGPDVEPMKFKSRREAREWCMAHHPGSPIEEIGRSGKRAAKKPLPKSDARGSDRRSGRPQLAGGQEGRLAGRRSGGGGPDRSV